MNLTDDDREWPKSTKAACEEAKEHISRLLRSERDELKTQLAHERAAREKAEAELASKRYARIMDEDLMARYESHIEKLEAELAAPKDQSPPEGHDEICYFCGNPCNSLAGDPGKWPVFLWQGAISKETGKAFWHHAGCVMEKLDELAALRTKCTWRPISEAPRDGTSILLVGKYQEPFRGFWSPRRKKWVSEGCDGSAEKGCGDFGINYQTCKEEEITHFMSLPAPPEDEP